VITGERIRLRAISRDDLPMFVDWLNDQDVREGLSLHYPMSVDNEQKWYDAMLQEPIDEHPLTIEIRNGDAWVTVGNCGFHKIDWRNRSAEVGIFIGEKSYWNQGYGTETMRLLLSHGFDTLNLNRIFLRVFSQNARAIRAYEKVGFKYEGLFRQAEYQKGRYIDVQFMSVLHSEWHDAQGQVE
jgi:RimJ/RimL family protein N-acetyltransferase